MAWASRPCILFILSAITSPILAAPAPSTQPILRIVSDPNNLPFSNSKLEGFENKIAQLIADDLGTKIEYTWWAQRRGFFREAIKHGSSEIVMGVPADLDRVGRTRPYYSSTYVFIHREDRKLDIKSFDDPALKKLKIGVPLVGGNNNTPPAQALADRGIVNNIVGYTVYGDYSQPNPNSKIVQDVATGGIDVAIVWGPTGGYFAKKQTVPLKVVPITDTPQSSTPFAYDICIGVKRSNPALKDQIDRVLLRRQAQIDKIMDDYSVPRAPTTKASVPKQSNATPSH